MTFFGGTARRPTLVSVTFSPLRSLVSPLFRPETAQEMQATGHCPPRGYPPRLDGAVLVGGAEVRGEETSVPWS
ncbi:hypothetical protein GCM10027075_46580 [Streptomyces heilongjiangensis]